MQEAALSDSALSYRPTSDGGVKPPIACRSVARPAPNPMQQTPGTLPSAVTSTLPGSSLDPGATPRYRLYTTPFASPTQQPTTTTTSERGVHNLSTMQLSIATTLLAYTAVHAFSDSSPFVLFSTSKYVMSNCRREWCPLPSRHHDSCATSKPPCAFMLDSN